MSKSPREYIRHIFDEIDYVIVWDVATTKLAPLRRQLESLLDSIKECQ